MSLPLHLLDPAQWRPTNLDVEITARCNLHCRYCYLEKAGSTQAAGDMDDATVDQVVRYIDCLSRFLPARGEINVCLFGGEPFLNFHAMRRLVVQCQRKDLPTHFEVFTNGASATPAQIEWCKRHGVAAKRSVGGCPDACAVTRPGDYLARYHRETGCWEDFGSLRRITVTPQTAGFLLENVIYFRKVGYHGPLDFATDDYGEWSVLARETYKAQITALAEWYVRAFRDGVVLGVENFRVLGKRMFQNSRVMTIGCGAGWGLQAITWDGWVVPCHRFLREPRDSPMCGGRLADLLYGRAPTFGEVLTRRIFDCAAGLETTECRLCSARQSCQHGCLHVSWITSGGLSKSPAVRCEFTKHWRNTVAWIHRQLEPLDEQWYLREPTKCEPEWKRGEDRRGHRPA